MGLLGTLCTANLGKPTERIIASKMPVLVASNYKANLEKHLKGGYTVKLKKGTKQITFLRNLIAGVLYEPGGTSIEDFLVIFELYDRCVGKAETDPVFGEKYGEWLITVHQVLVRWKPRSFPFTPTNVREDIERLAPYLPSKAAYFGWRRNPARGGSAKVVLRSQMQPPKAIPKRFVGVGYKDKGTRRDPATDGTPRWQDAYEYDERASGPGSEDRIQRIKKRLEKTSGRRKSDYGSED